MHKIKVYHFHNGGGGGVLSVVRNLFKFSNNPGIENHIIYTINRRVQKFFEPPKLEGAETEQVFYWIPEWNNYYTFKKLSKLLPQQNTVLVAHDLLELGMISHLGLPQPVILFLHGNYNYYFDLAQNHKDVIDRFLCISKPIFNRLKARLPERLQDIKLRYFPVPPVKFIPKNNQALKIYFGVRNLEDKEKGFNMIPVIDELLKKNNIEVEWTIVGSTEKSVEVKAGLRKLRNFEHYTSLSNDKILTLLEAHDIFVLPSSHEGLPVSLIEAMKAGVVPLITNWENATEDLVVEGQNGFYIQIGNAAGYADTIQLLDEDRDLLSRLSTIASTRANELFDPRENCHKIEDVYTSAVKTFNRHKNPKKIYGSRLDEAWIPNFITYFIRDITYKIKDAFVINNF